MQLTAIFNAPKLQPAAISLRILVQFVSANVSTLLLLKQKLCACQKVKLLPKVTMFRELYLIPRHKLTNIAPKSQSGLHVRFWSCNFGATKIACVNEPLGWHNVLGKWYSTAPLYVAEANFGFFPAYLIFPELVKKCNYVAWYADWFQWNVSKSL